MLEQTKIKIQPMKYRSIMPAVLSQNFPSTEVEDNDERQTGSDRMDFEARLQELKSEQEKSEWNFQVELNAVRQEAFEAGRKSQESENSAALATAYRHLAEAIEEFRQSRDRYLAQVEREVVRLALEIAERILHRQAQMDPLLLSGAVRVALGQLAETTEVRLKVPFEEREMWAEMLRLMPNLPLRPELAVDERMTAGECTIETHLGSVDIGVRTQLDEIERGFFDLLEHRKQAASGSLEAGR